MKRQLSNILYNQEGVSAIILTLMLLVIFAMAALAIDIGYIAATRGELQNAADSAALAATNRLGDLYLSMTPGEQATYVLTSGDEAIIEGVATTVLSKNKAAYENIQINATDIDIGQWDGSSFTETPDQPDAVEVTVRREQGSINGPISTIFAKIFNIDTLDVTAEATAALTGVGETNESDLELPIGLDEKWFEVNEGVPGETPGWCGKQVKFAPTTDPEACGGWTTWNYGSNDANMRKILQESLESPKSIVGETDFEFTGGKLSNPTFADLLTLFQNKGSDINKEYTNEIDGSLDFDSLQLDSDNNKIVVPDNFKATDDASKRPLCEGSCIGDPLENQLQYPDGTPRFAHAWLTKVVVYAANDCDNPNQTLFITGFADIMLYDVLDSPYKKIQGFILCNSFKDLRGGGGDFGTKGTIAGLVK